MREQTRHSEVRRQQSTRSVQNWSIVMALHFIKITSSFFSSKYLLLFSRFLFMLLTETVSSSQESSFFAQVFLFVHHRIIKALSCYYFSRELPIFLLVNFLFFFSKASISSTSSPNFYPLRFLEEKTKWAFTSSSSFFYWKEILDSWPLVYLLIF